jgi:hypothetical protein
MKIIKEANNGSYALGIAFRKTVDQWNNKIYTFYCGLWCWHFMSNRTNHIHNLLNLGFTSKDGIHFRDIYFGVRLVSRKRYFTILPQKVKFKY